MMTFHTFLHNTALLLAAMAFLAILETAVPFFRSGWRKRHLLQNLGLTALTLSLNLVLNAGAVLVTAGLETRGFGVLAFTSLPPWLTTIIAIVVLDASTYACHRLLHAIPLLWKAHTVHHSDPLVDVTTALRFHPVETLWRFAFIIVPASLLALPAGAVAIYRMVSVFFALLEHMNVKLWQPLDTVLSFVIGTPNMHKVHHCRFANDNDKNFGNILSLFDRGFGTFAPSERAASVQYGLMD